MVRQTPLARSFPNSESVTSVEAMYRLVRLNGLVIVIPSPKKVPSRLENGNLLLIRNISFMLCGPRTFDRNLGAVPTRRGTPLPLADCGLVVNAAGLRYGVAKSGFTSTWLAAPP